MTNALCHVMHNDIARAPTLGCGTTSSIVSLYFSITSAHERDGPGVYRWYCVYHINTVPSVVGTRS